LAQLYGSLRAGTFGFGNPSCFFTKNNNKKTIPDSDPRILKIIMRFNMVGNYIVENQYGKHGNRPHKSKKSLKKGRDT
jgi:hypothetical protein